MECVFSLALLFCFLLPASCSPQCEEAAPSHGLAATDTPAEVLHKPVEPSSSLELSQYKSFLPLLILPDSVHNAKAADVMLLTAVGNDKPVCGPAGAL